MIETGENIIFHGLFQVQFENYQNVLAAIEYESGRLDKVQINRIILTDVEKPELNQLKIEE